MRFFTILAAAEFVSLIERFSSDYQNRPVSEVLSAILDESGYECMLRTEGSQERLDNLAELKQSVHEYEVSCGEELTLENYLAHAALFTTSDAAGTGNNSKAHDRPHGKRSGVSMCFFMRHE